MRPTSSPTMRSAQPGVAGVSEILTADFPVDSHAYPLHTHDAWTLLLVDSGCVTYQLDRREHLAPVAAVTLLPPHVPHDGKGASSGGFRKRVVYLDAPVLAGLPLDHVLASPCRTDAVLAREVGALHQALAAAATGVDRLDAESRLAQVRDRLMTAWNGPTRTTPPPPPTLAGQLRELLDARVTEGVTLTEAATQLGSSAPSLVRAFQRDVGMSPHRYLVGRRVDRARRLLAGGASLAEAASEAGFFDQAHLTRHFRAHLGVTPGRYTA